MRSILVLFLFLALGGAAPAPTPGLKTSVFAGGCFWSAEHDMEGVRGVVDVVVGYSGGARGNPNYEDHEGHLEAIRVTWDPARTTYADLVAAFFRNIDPTDPNGQICDIGPSYRTAVFVSDDAERRIAEQVKADVPASCSARSPPGSWPARPSGWARATIRTMRPRTPATTIAIGSDAVAMPGSVLSGQGGAEGRP